MTVRVTCDGCGRVEEPRRLDICEVTLDWDGLTIIRDYCAKCQGARTDQIKKIFDEE